MTTLEINLIRILQVWTATVIVLALIRVFCTKEKIYSESFWWDTWNGFNYSTATLYRYKYINWYVIEIDRHYGDPLRHPDYDQFLKNVDRIKKEHV